MDETTSAEDRLEYYRNLLDYRARVQQLYAKARSDTGSPARRLEAFRNARNLLLGSHPHSPVPADRRAAFHGVAYYPYDRRLRFTPAVEPDRERTRIELGGLTCERVGWISFVIDGTVCRLALFWILGYAGGLLLPFADRTTGSETFGGGRYVWDSLKGANLGFEGERIVIDFNFACHPSSGYDPGMTRPAPPAENRLDVAIRAGERLPPSP